jgi:hypothetical protein
MPMSFGEWSLSFLFRQFFAQDRVLTVQRSNNVARERDENGNPVKSRWLSWMEIVRNGDKIEGILSPRRNGLSVDTATFPGQNFLPYLLLPISQT